MSDDIVYQKVGEIQQLHPEWDPNDIFAALLTCNCNNAQAILKLMIQGKLRITAFFILEEICLKIHFALLSSFYLRS